ncbi:MAG: hypothetical protein IPJ76_16640 [Flavobacteriales bacterium]|nr:MAG: hypothetical protein IPJ76_16640 [Flavobacteriales bacterium]
MRKALPLIALVLSGLHVAAQEFERKYTLDNTQLEVSNASLLADGGYALAMLDWATNSFIVMRTDQSGEPIWARSFAQQAGISLGTASTMGQFANGDVYALVNGYGSMGEMRTLLRFSQTGVLIWSKQLQFGNMYDMDYSYRAAKVSEQTNGDLLLSIPATMDPVIAKLSGNGAPIWAKSFTSTEDTLYDKHPTFDCEPTDDGGCVICGKDRDWPFVIKVDANGNVVWNQTYYQVTTYSHLRNMEILPNGDLLFAGMQDSYAMMMRMSPSGTILWMKHYMDDYYFESLRPLDDGTFMIANGTYGSLLHVNADGDVLSRFVQNSNMSSGLFCLSGEGGAAHLAGNVYDNNTWESNAYAARFAPDSPPGCLYTEASATVIDNLGVANTVGTTTMVQQTEPMVVNDLAIAFQPVSIADGALCGIAAGIEETGNNAVTLFPTLVSEGQPLTIDLGSFTGAQFQWVASNGALVKQQSLNTSKGTLITVDLATGLYALLATSNGILVHTARIVVE